MAVGTAQAVSPAPIEENLDAIHRKADRRIGLVDLITAAILLGAGLAVAASSEFNRDVVLLVCVYTLAGLGMYVPLVLNGQLSLAYAAYVSMGAYAVGWVSLNTSISPAIGIIFGMAVAAIAAALLGLVTVKLNGFYLAGVTFLFDRAFKAYIIESDWIGGASGLSNFSAGQFLGVQLTRPVVSAAALVVTLLLVVYVARLRRGPFGLLARFQREAGRTVESAGVRSLAVKVACLALGAAIAAVAGGLFTLQNRSVYPETFGLNILSIAIFAPLLGGQRSPWGAALGAAVVCWLYFGMNVAQDTGTLVFSLAVVAIVRLAPGGVLGLVSSLWAKVRPNT